MKLHMPNMEELLNQISTAITRVQHGPRWMSKIDIAYANSLLKSKFPIKGETSKHRIFAVTGGNMNDFYGFRKRFCCLSNIPTKIQEKIDKTMNYQTSVWLDDLNFVTRRVKKNTE